MLGKVRSELLHVVVLEACLSELGARIPSCKIERKLEYSCTRHVMVAIIALTHIYIYMSGLFSICFSDRKLRYQTVWFKTRHMATVFSKTSLAARHCAICIHTYYVCYVLLNPCNAAVSKVSSY